MSGFYFIALVASYFLCVSGLVSYQCYMKAEENCDQNLFPDEFPETVDQLRDACRDITELEDCMLKSFESCTDEPNYDERIEELRRITGYIHDVCSEDSEIFEVISSNLHCIASNSEKIRESCQALTFSEPTEDIINRLITNMFEHANTSQYTRDSPDVWCIQNLWADYCASIKVGLSCGPEVGAAVREILTQIEDRLICTEEFVAEVTPMLEAIESAIVEEEKLKKLEQEEKEAVEEKGDSRKRRFASPFRAFRDFY